MATELVLTPPVPQGLREAALTGRLIPFVGAGASRLAGCPRWADFADRALIQLVDKGNFTYSQLDQIKHLNPRIKLSIATAIAAKANSPIDYDSVLHPSPRIEQARGRRLYNSLFALSNIFVTTNYDRWLDDRIAEPVLGAAPASTPSTPSQSAQMESKYKVNDFLPAALMRPNTVVHLHGSVADPESMILTTHDYVKRYAADHRTGDASVENYALTFLEHLFAHYTVLFIGYGLEELEILEYIILKAKRHVNTAESEARHFLLQGFFSHEATLMDHMESYYAHECGIQLIPYLRDQRDHDQLVEVLEDFARRMPRVSAPHVLGQQLQLEDLAREMEPLG